MSNYVDPASPPDPVAKLTFSDEFSGPIAYYEGDPVNGKWFTNYDYAGEDGVGSYTLTSNNELQIYTSPYFRLHNDGSFGENPFTINQASTADPGSVSIWAKPSSNPEIFGYHYTSGLLDTKHVFYQEYGYFEMRAQLPATDGAWPAFWLLPQSGWPPEIDVMEQLGKKPDVIYVTEHTGASNTQEGTAIYLPSPGGMHTYGLLWTDKVLAWYIDGQEAFSTATPADLHQPMYMLAGQALGGWGGPVNDAEMPAETKIDYIRAYDTLPSYLAAPPGAGKVITGTSRSEKLAGTAGSDTLNAGGGADTVTGGAGDDLINGGSGDDRFVFVKGAFGHDVLPDFTIGTRNDALVFIGFGAERPVIVQTERGGLVTFMSTHESVLLQYDNSASLQKSDFMFGTDANDSRTWALSSVSPTNWIVA